ncbi:hypothetical protein CPB85DRAFT_1264668 [Mucidula mucida]|nr:hypothetical protein CPB85DRAFT_1264668 [Mucidula mucida]
MPPRPQPRPRKASASAKDPGTLTQADKDAKAMPPPPLPKRILEPELVALSTHLKNAMVKTGLIYGFSADTRRLGIQKHAPKPPLSLTSALGSEVEKYDQLCDAMESHLLRAIAILERELKREEQRLREAEEAAKASAMQVDNPEPIIPPPTSEAVSIIPSSSSPTSAIPGRRPSAISISSLHRPAFPLKLDLSAPGLRISPDEVTSFTIPDGLHSPVTLAPKSARPTDFPHDLIDMASLTSVPPEASSSSGRVDIDLTLSDAPAEGTGAEINIDASMGTADKPIELDLDSMDIDMSDLFGGDAFAHSDLAGKGKEDTADFLNSLGDDAGNEELFSLEGQQPKAQVAGPANQTAPSPGTLLASFTAGNAEGNGNQFNLENIDYNFFGNGEDPNAVMDQFLGDINGSNAAAGPSTKAE